jgi:hypothetical protein
VQLSLEKFSAFSIIIGTGTKAFQKGEVYPSGALFLFSVQEAADRAAAQRIF